MADKAIKDIRRATRKTYSAEENIRIVLEGLRGEDSIAALGRREGIAESMYYTWSKEFLEAGKRRLTGDTARTAIRDEVKATAPQRAKKRRKLKEKPANGRSRVLWISGAASVLILLLEGIHRPCSRVARKRRRLGQLPLGRIRSTCLPLVDRRRLHPVERASRAKGGTTAHQARVRAEQRDVNPQVEEAKRQTAFIDLQTHRLLRADQLRSFEDELGNLEALLKRHHDSGSFMIAGSGFAFQFKTMLQTEQKP